MGNLFGQTRPDLFLEDVLDLRPGSIVRHNSDFPEQELFRPHALSQQQNRLAGFGLGLANDSMGFGRGVLDGLMGPIYPKEKSKRPENTLTFREKLQAETDRWLRNALT